MLQIDITGFIGDNLILEVNGRKNRGRSEANGNEDVSWTVRPGSGVSYIHAIKMKEVSFNDDIFSSNPPHAQNKQRKQWVAKVNNIVTNELYIYNIEWVKEGESKIRIYDPIISIRPIRAIIEKTILLKAAIITASIAIIAAIVLSILLYRSYQENLRLKNIDQFSLPNR